MSHILDALKRAERDRNATRGPSPAVTRWLAQGQTMLDTLARILSDGDRVSGALGVAQREAERLQGVVRDLERTRGLVEKLWQECDQLRAEGRHLQATLARAREEREALAQWFTTVLAEAASRFRSIPPPCQSLQGGETDHDRVRLEGRVQGTVGAGSLSGVAQRGRMSGESPALAVQPPGTRGDGRRARRSGWRRLWRALIHRDGTLVLDRRQGDRRRRARPVAQERRRRDRRHPLPIDFSDVHTFLGEDTQLRGELRFEGAVRLDGRLEGGGLQGDVLIIGPRGQVTTAIEARLVQVRGQVEGPISAQQQVELREASRVSGTIRTPRLLIWEGARFTGRYELAGPTHA